MSFIKILDKVPYRNPCSLQHRLDALVLLHLLLQLSCSFHGSLPRTRTEVQSHCPQGIPTCKCPVLTSYTNPLLQSCFLLSQNWSAPTSIEAIWSFLPRLSFSCLSNYLENSLRGSNAHQIPSFWTSRTDSTWFHGPKMAFFLKEQEGGFQSVFNES